MLLQLLLISLIIQVVLFVPAYLLRTDKLTDLSYSLTFIVLSGYLYLISSREPEMLLIILMICTWGARLGYYLVKRIWKIGTDKRFDEIRTHVYKFLGFWIFQGFVVPFILLPLMFFLNGETEFSLLLVPGLVVWLSGLLIETLSDMQKFRFINNPKNKGRWVDTGFWKYSRHPNYLGEIVCWIGIYLFTYPYLYGSQKLIALISPLTISILLVFVSGIPILEKKANTKWGNDLDYQEYKKKTAVLIPYMH